MINWDYMITYGGPELFLVFVAIVLTPIIYRLILKRFKLVVKITGIFSLWVIAIFIAYWDVYQIAKEAERLCREEAGLHVYKTVEAEGFLGSSSIEYWSKYGFKYVEMEFIGGKKYRNSLVNNKITREEVKEIFSRYEYVGDSEELELPFTRDKKMIRVRKTGEVLGEIISFAVYPGWLDSYLLGVIPATWSPPRCDDNYIPENQKAIHSYSDLVKAVIKPVSSN